MVDDKMSVDEMVNLAREKFMIQVRPNKEEEKKHNQIRMKIKRTMDCLKNDKGISLWKAAETSIKGKERTKFLFDKYFALELLYSDHLHDYLCSLSDCPEIRAGRTKQKILKQKRIELKKQYAEDMNNMENWKELLAVGIGPDDLGIPYNNSGYPCDENGRAIIEKIPPNEQAKIEQHMLKKIFEQLFSPFDYERYKDDLATSLSCRNPYEKTDEEMEADERLENLSHYYEEQSVDGLVDKISAKVIKEIVLILEARKLIQPYKPSVGFKPESN